MPNRLIREALLDSPRYAGLTIEARLLFVHILLLADDFGCISVSPTFLRRRAFYDSPTDQKITKLLLELVDAGMVRTYEVDRSTFGYIPKFRQRLQRSTLRHPKPPVELFNDDFDVKEKFLKINENRTNPTVGQRGSNGGPTGFQPLANGGPTSEVKRSEEKRRTTLSGEPDGFAAFWTIYPRREAKQAAIKAFRSLAPSPDLQTEILANVKARAGSDQWQRGFIPLPASYLNGRRWEDEDTVVAKHNGNGGAEWKKSEAGIQAKRVELGVKSIPGESWQQLIGRIEERIAHHG